MKNTYEVIISGIGGQGTVVSGAILGEAASSYDNKFAVMTCTYGTEARGTFAKSDILISDNFITYYEALNPDIILVLSDKAYPHIKNRIDKETIVVINSNEVNNYEKILGKVYALPLSEMAVKVGSLQALNMIALGFMVGLTQMISREALIKTVENKYKNKRDYLINIKAIEEGWKMI
ncbi:MAG: 2-oxoacid:ferredoxin oxidoreductase subunit gamma [Candidatus Caldatribacteriota bacterium]